MTDATYDRTWAQLLDAEHALRALAEAQLREYVGVLEQLALSLAPGEADARKRDDPACFTRLTAAEWLAFFAGVVRRPQPVAAGWTLAPDPTAARDAPEALAQLRRELAAVQAENHRLRDLTQQLRQEKAALAATLKEKGRPERAATPGGRVRPAPAAAQAVEAGPGDRAESGAAGPPAQYAQLFNNWPLQGPVLTIMAATGWSLRQAVMRRLAGELGINQGDKRLRVLFTTLADRGLVQQRLEVVDGTVGAGSVDGQVRVAIVRLSGLAGRVLAELGLRPVVSEWERLEACAGPDQIKRIAWACAFADHARERGYEVEMCPEAARPVRPELRLTRGGERVDMFVREAEAAIAWAELVDGAGAVALGTSARAARSELVAAARAAGVAHGRATDLEFLLAGADRDAFWAETW